MTSLYLKEAAAAAGALTAWGQFWAKNTTPNQLWFADDTGVDDRLAYPYEEGSFTPTLLDDNFNPSEGQTYGGNRYGQYRKIGNMVFVVGCLDMAGLGSLTTTASASIGGLPFTNATVAVGGLAHVAIPEGTGLALATPYQTVFGRMTTGSWFSFCYALSYAVTPRTIAEVSASGELHFSASYRRN